MPRTTADVDADLAVKRAKANTMHELHPERAELRAEIDALLEERHRLTRTLRPSHVLARR
jgi:hypothetical protein